MDLWVGLCRYPQMIPCCKMLQTTLADVKYIRNTFKRKKAKLSAMQCNAPRNRRARRVKFTLGVQLALA
jgi:hypothetical protein